MKDKITFNRSTSMSTTLSMTCLLFVVIFCLASTTCAELQADMNQTKTNVSVQLSGKINIEIANNQAFFSPSHYHFVLEPSKDILVQNNKENAKEDFKNAFQRKIYHNEETRLKDLVNLSELYQKSYGESPTDRWLTSEGQEAIFRHINPNKQLSYIIFDQETGDAMLIDLNSRNIKKFFQNARQFTWDKMGNRFIYASAVKIQNLDFIIYDVSQNKGVLEETITVRSPKGFAEISNFDWSPDSQFVAVLTCNVVDIGFFSSIMGHPIATTKFDVFIFDLSGNRVYAKQIDGVYKGGCFARIIWDKERE